MKRFLRTIITTICLVLTSVAGQASECRRVFDEGNYEKALPICIKEDRNFELGYIYGSYKKNCVLMEKYYLKSGSNSSIGNLGINLLYGKSGCDENIDEGIKYLNQTVDKGSVHYADILGDHYRKVGNRKLAKTNYLKVVKSEASNDWQQNRTNESFNELMKLLNFEEKTKLLAARDLNKDKKCELGRILYTDYFTKIIEKFGYQHQDKQFTKSLCKGDREYFLGLTFENGFGNKEDLREAYRLYLLAGAEGSPDAKRARDRIRDQLSPEQIAAATCIADYGLDPNIFYKWRCGW